MGSVKPVYKLSEIARAFQMTRWAARRWLDALVGGGTPLAPSTRAFMEPRFGHDFSAVRVHTGAAATDAAAALNARAFTIGRDVVFGAEQYAPDGEGGKRLLAHELVHTVQQSPGLTPRPVVQRSPDDSSTGSMHQDLEDRFA
jgi:hypothetical protein